jgi:protein-tyrosine phosphatase
LTLLGVPKETVMADYLRTNDYLLPYYKKTIDGFAAQGGDRAIIGAILGVKREYLEAAFEDVRSSYGSIENYFTKGLGIDSAGQKALRDLYLKELGL